jgi:DNA-binding beta-propeller fold protein YncE
MNPGSTRLAVLVAVLMFLLATAAAAAQLAISANDGKVMLVDGVNTPRPDPQPDTVSIIDVRTFPPKVIATVQAPTSVAGPPHSVAIAPDQSIALVTSSSKINPANPKEAIQNDQVSVIDLQSSPPRLLVTLHAGSGASSVTINRAGTLALVANRAEGTVSVFTITGKAVAAAGKVDLQGGPDSGPSQVMFTADGKTAWVSCNAATDNRIAILTVNGSRVEYIKSETSDFYAGLRPYGMDITPSGDLAVIANIGAGFSGGVDVVSLIDLRSVPPRAIDQIPVGPVPEGISVSPNGRYVAVSVMNGTNAPKASPFFHDFGLLKVLRIDGRTLSLVTETKIGHWCQGVAWTPDSSTVLAQCMVEREIQMFGFNGKALKPAGSIKVNGGPAGIRTSR